jgi:hypothetical protein
MRFPNHIVRKILIGISFLWINMAAAQSIADDRIDLETKNKTLKEVFAMIEKSSGFHFVYNEDLISAYPNMSIRAKNRTIASVLSELFQDTNLQYLEQHNKIIISEKHDYHTDPKREIIQGRIFEAESGKPVRNVSVYFDGSLNVTASDSTGSFTLYSSTNSRTPIVISAIGYFPETITDYPSGKRLIIYLKTRQYELDPVEITISDGGSRREKLRIFRKEFLGSSDNGKNSRIQNESDIALGYNKQTRTLKASCNKPIMVQNRNLGYTFNFLLENFMSSETKTLFYGPQYFKEDLEQAGNKKIEKARAEAYLGSRMHFIRSLWNNELSRNGFEIYGNNILKNKVGYDDIVVNIDGQKYLRLVETLRIIYKGKVSFLYKNEAQKDIYMDKEGYNDPIGLDWGGYIATQRAGDLLPLEYKQ